MEGFLSDIEIIPFGIKEADQAASIRVKLAKRGSPIGAYDILIGATALANDYMLVTSNEGEFRRIEGIRLENWR